MPDAAEPAHMSIDRNVVGRVGENKIGALVLQEMMEGPGMPGIAAQQASARPAGSASAVR